MSLIGQRAVVTDNFKIMNPADFRVVGWLEDILTNHISEAGERGRYPGIRQEPIAIADPLGTAGLRPRARSGLET